MVTKLKELAGIGATVEVSTSYSCREGLWGWAVHVSGPRSVNPHMHEEVEEEDDLIDEATMINIAVWDEDPERALDRVASAYRSAYADVIVAAGE